MNWLEAFWKKLTAPPPSAARKTYTSSSTPMPAAGETPPGSPGQTPITGIKTKWNYDPGDEHNPAANFTPRAHQALALASKEAERFHHNFIGTEHLLLGLMKLGQGVAVNVLMKMGLDPEIVRAEVEKQVGTGPDQKIIGNIPYTPRVRKVLALAAKEAKALNHTYVGTEHLLLGLLREGDGVAARVLQNLGIDTEKARQAILKELDPNFGGSSALRELAETSASTASQAALDRSELPRDRFTPRVRRTFTLALEEAEQRKQAFVETEHVLLGLLRMGQGVAAHVLIKIGVNAEIVADRIEDGPAPGAHTNEPPLFSPLVKEVLVFAAEEARTLEHTYIGTEHILLGLLRQPHGGASRILKELYVDPAALRKQVLLAFEVKKVEPAAAQTGDKAVPPSEKDTEMYAKKTSPEQNLGSASASVPLRPAREAVDIGKRYDVYCVEHEKIVIHRNVGFKATQSLLPRSEEDRAADFVELEQADGQCVFVSKSSIIRFCAPGVKPEIENL
jgi:ATP-dependent Clp protease ATP-binding subunit ClpA